MAKMGRKQKWNVGEFWGENGLLEPSLQGFTSESSLSVVILKEITLPELWILSCKTALRRVSSLSPLRVKWDDMQKIRSTVKVKKTVKKKEKGADPPPPLSHLLTLNSLNGMSVLSPLSLFCSDHKWKNTQSSCCFTIQQALLHSEVKLSCTILTDFVPLFIHS